jgi:hypothetical protein
VGAGIGVVAGRDGIGVGVGARGGVVACDTWVGRIGAEVGNGVDIDAGAGTVGVAVGVGMVATGVAVEIAALLTIAVDLLVLVLVGAEVAVPSLTAWIEMPQPVSKSSSAKALDAIRQERNSRVILAPAHPVTG